MTLPIVLVDFENVQPKVLERLRPGSCRVKVFLGQHQSRLMLDLVQALQPFGSDAEYIQIHGTGPNAADFHIAYYVGRLAAAEPTTSFTIVSKDRGFDPLVRHLGSRGINCRRLAELPQQAAGTPARIVAATPPPATLPSATRPAAKIAPPQVKSANVAQANVAPSAQTTRARAKAVVDHLRKATKPARLSTLRSSIKALLKPTPDEAAIDAIVQSLKDTKVVSVTGTKVTYTLA